MERQTQVPGGRRWFGDDLLELQKESLKAIDAVVSMIEKPFAINGCKVVSGGIEKGFVALEKDGGMKIMPFLGTEIVGKCYIVPTKRDVMTPYADEVARLSAVAYEAVAQKEKPTSGSFLEVLANGKVTTFKEAIQDTSHKFVSDTERNIWNGKETPIGSQQKATKALADANIVAQTKATKALEDANIVAQTKATKAYTDATEVSGNYTVRLAGKAKADANAYTDTKANKTLSDANAEAKVKADKALSDAKKDAGIKANDAELNAKRYALGKCDTLESNKADKSKVIINEGEVSLDPFDRYTHANRVIYNSGSGGLIGDRGTIAQFCAGKGGFAIQAHKDFNRFFIARMELHQAPPYPNGQTPPSYYNWEKFELLHSGNTQIMNIYTAGKFTPFSYEKYVGYDYCLPEWESTSAGDVCKVTHYLRSRNYMVNITPIGGSPNSYTIVSKEPSYCKIKFARRTVFEIQILRYE